jgi:hypothetical protein
VKSWPEFSKIEVELTQTGAPARSFLGFGVVEEGVQQVEH